jgi:hypothetical protein
MITNKLRLRASLIGLIGFSLIAPLAAANAAPANDLGSPADTAQLFSEDYARLIEATLPAFRSEELARRLVLLREKYPNGDDSITLRKISDIESLLGLPQATTGGTDYIATKTHTYGISAKSGRVHFARNLEGQPPMAFEEAQRSQREIEARHFELLERAGISPAKVLYTNSGIVSLRTQSADMSDDKALLAADSVYTYALRSIEGLQVDGSEARLASRSGGDLVSLSLRWPAMQLHPQLTSFKLKSAEELKREILPQVKLLSNGAVVNLQMAVVLRPVSLDGRRVFVPSLKVGVLPKEEAGAVFYVDLPQQKLEYKENEVVDR